MGLAIRKRLKYSSLPGHNFLIFVVLFWVSTKGKITDKRKFLTQIVSITVIFLSY